MEKLSRKATELTRREWRDLRFFYCSDTEMREWRFIGSREGLLTFAKSLDAYATDPRYEAQSEHLHLGPHMYLKVMTWPHPGIDQHSIHGTLDDIKRLAGLIRQKLAPASPGEVITLGSEYCRDSQYKLVFSVKEDDFDPATEDPQLAG